MGNDGLEFMRGSGKVLILQCAPVAQLDRAFDYESAEASRINPQLIRKQFILSGFGETSPNAIYPQSGQRFRFWVHFGVHSAVSKLPGCYLSPVRYVPLMPLLNAPESNALKRHL